MLPNVTRWHDDVWRGCTVRTCGIPQRAAATAPCHACMRMPEHRGPGTSCEWDVRGRLNKKSQRSCITVNVFVLWLPEPPFLDLLHWALCCPCLHVCILPLIYAYYIQYTSLMNLSAPVANYVPYVITGSPMFIFVPSAVFDIPLHFVLRSFLTYHCLPPLSYVQEI